MNEESRNPNDQETGRDDADPDALSGDDESLGNGTGPDTDGDHGEAGTDPDRQDRACDDDGGQDDAQGAHEKRDPEAEIAALKDRLLRAVAETENLRRRSEREKQETATYSITTFARDLLSVSDNLRRALEALPDEIASDGKIKAFVEGVQMTERELLATLEKHGIRKIVPEGEKFDHNYHQAMFEVESADAAPGTVVQVVQPGYVIKERLLRPAMVGVARAPSNEASTGVDTTV